MLDGDMTDMVEAQSLSLKQQYIDIYSSSWGPDDDGRTVDGPGPLARLALENGIRKVSLCLCVYDVHYRAVSVKTRPYKTQRPILPLTSCGK